MKGLTIIFKRYAICIKQVAYMSICTLMSLMVSNQASAGNRFDPPSLASSLGDFNKRLDSGNLNVDFIVAHSFNTARKLERDANEFGDKALALFTNINKNRNESVSSNSALSNSIVVPPGTKADTIIIINQTEGDSFAIHR